jgi:hypothetical protein
MANIEYIELYYKLGGMRRCCRWRRTARDSRPSGGCALIVDGSNCRQSKVTTTSPSSSLSLGPIVFFSLFSSSHSLSLSYLLPLLFVIALWAILSFTIILSFHGALIQTAVVSFAGAGPPQTFHNFLSSSPPQAPFFRRTNPCTTDYIVLLRSLLFPWPF